MEKQTYEKLPLTNDFVFKRVFTKEAILADFLSAIVKREIKTIEIKNPEISKDKKNAKIGILDIRAQLDHKEWVDIEMQVNDQKNIEKRSTFYMADLYSDQLKKKQGYKETLKVIMINILNFNYYQRNSYHSVAHMKFEKSEPEENVEMGYQQEEECLTEDLEIHMIELPKFKKKNPEVQTKLAQWLWLLIGEEEKIKMAEKENEQIKEANELLEEISQNEEDREYYRLRLKAYRDERDLYMSGKEEGREEGKEEGKEEIAIEMLKKGFDETTIEEITSVSKEKIKALKSNYKIS